MSFNDAAFTVGIFASSSSSGVSVCFELCLAKLRTPAVEQLLEKTLLMLVFGRENFTCFSPSVELFPSAAPAEDRPKMKKVF